MVSTIESDNENYDWVLIKNPDGWLDIKKKFLEQLQIKQGYATNGLHKKAAEYCGVPFHTFRKLGKTTPWIKGEMFERITDVIGADSLNLNGTFESFSNDGKIKHVNQQRTNALKDRLQDEYSTFKANLIKPARRAKKLRKQNMPEFLEMESLRYISEVTDTSMDFFKTLSVGAKNDDLRYNLLFDLCGLFQTYEETKCAIQIYKYLISSETPKHDLEILEEINNNQIRELKSKDVRKILIKFDDVSIVNYFVELIQKDNKPYHMHKYYSKEEHFERLLSEKYAIILEKLETKLKDIDEANYMCLNFGADGEPIKTITYEQVNKLCETYGLETFYDIEWYLDNYESGTNCITDIPLDEIYGTNLIYNVELLGKSNDNISLINQDTSKSKLILDYALGLMKKNSFNVLDN